MNIFPVRQETIVSSHKASEVIKRLQMVTSQPRLSKDDLDPGAIFIGRLDGYKFRISIKVNAPENFLPIIVGSVDETTIGCIVYLKFNLFFSSLLFLTFWSLVSISITLFFYFVVRENLYAIIALSAGAVNYMVTLFYFQKKAKESHEALMEVLKMSK